MKDVKVKNSGSWLSSLFLLQASLLIPFLSFYSLCTSISVFLFELSAVKLRDRVLILMGKAYRSIRLEDLCILLGQPEEEVKLGMG